MKEWRLIGECVEEDGRACKRVEMGGCEDKGKRLEGRKGGGSFKRIEIEDCAKGRLANV